MVEEFDDAWKVLRMCHAAAPPALELFQRLAEVLEDLSVDEFDLTVGREGRNEPGNAVHDQTRLTFAFAQRILGALPLVDIRQQHAPAGNLAVAHRERENRCWRTNDRRRPNAESAAIA